MLCRPNGICAGSLIIDLLNNIIFTFYILYAVDHYIFQVRQNYCLTNYTDFFLSLDNHQDERLPKIVNKKCR